MPLKSVGTIAIPNATDSSFDHAAFDAKTRRIFVVHTARDCVEVVDHDNAKYVRTLPGFPGAAGIVADDGQVLVTNRGSATLAWLDAETFAIRGILRTGAETQRGCDCAPARTGRLPRVSAMRPGHQGFTSFGLGTRQSYAIDLPGRPRWCVTDLAGQRVFLAIQNPSMVLVARLPELEAAQHWNLPALRRARSRYRSHRQPPVRRLRRRRPGGTRCRLGAGHE